MVQILPAVQRTRKPTFSEKIGLNDIARNFGEGLAESRQSRLVEEKIKKETDLENAAVLRLTDKDISGIKDPKMREKYVEMALQQENKLQQLNQKQNFLNSILGGKNQEQNQQNMGSQLMGNQTQETPQMGNQTNQTPQQQFDPLSISDSDIARVTSMDPAIGRELRSAKDTAIKGERENRRLELEKERYEEGKRTGKEKEYFKLNEPKVMQLTDDLRKLETEETRYNRLENLFRDSSKFPSSFTAALFTKDGNINDLVYSQLTPEAQEAVKLIIDSTSNIKDSYGARVTNFDLQTYLKKLPSLLNSAEGKNRVLRDLQIMNQLNQLHANGIQDIFEEAGGTDKIPYSTAEQRYKKKYGQQEKQLKDLFVNADKGVFNDFPDPQKYLGRKVKDTKTGEVFISDGNEWKPFEG